MTSIVPATDSGYPHRRDDIIQFHAHAQRWLASPRTRPGDATAPCDRGPDVFIAVGPGITMRIPAKMNPDPFVFAWQPIQR